MFLRISFGFLLAFCFVATVVPQAPKLNQDSLRYQAIEKFSKKTKFSRFIHKLTFRPINSKVIVLNQNKKENYTRVEGAIVRDINITTLDPFGYNIQDTTIHPRGFFKKAGNTLHKQTRNKIIENLLLFKRNEPFDSLLVNESERLIRLQKYVRDVFFYAVPTSGAGDSADVYITVADIWSIVPAYKRSSTAINFGITENNVLGYGHAFHADNQKNRISNTSITQFSYYVPNIGNSYISSRLEYFFTDSTDLVKSIEFERTFFSPLTKWAGGIFFGKLITYQTYTLSNSVRLFSAPTNILDIWGARSWQLFKDNSSDARTASLIVSSRFLMTRYPGAHPDEVPIGISGRENFYFAGIGITSRKYFQDKYIFKFGKTEDVPVGRYFGITTGLEARQKHRWYIGFKAAWGNYYSLGYLSSHLEYGTFKDESGFNQQVVTGHINYFTPLINIGNWRVRQFVKPTFIFGINRLPTDNLTFREEIMEFDGAGSTATHMLALTLQTQSYPPWDLFGFRFGPYLFSTFGMLGNKSGFSNSRLYSFFGLGVLIKNDYLMFDTFQISLVYYPFLPDKGYHIFKANAYNTSDFGFKDFELGKPGVVDYR